MALLLLLLLLVHPAQVVEGKAATFAASVAFGTAAFAKAGGPEEHDEAIFVKDAKSSEASKPGSNLGV